MMKLTISLLLVFQVVAPMPHNTVNHPNEITNPANPKLSHFMPVNSIPHKIFRRSLPFSLDKKKDKEGTKAETHRDDASGGNDYSQQLLPNQVGHAQTQTQTATTTPPPASAIARRETRGPRSPVSTDADVALGSNKETE